LSETVEQRVLAAFQFIDRSTGDILDRPLKVSSPEVKFIKNRSHQYIVASVPGLRTHNEAFKNPPAEPPTGSIPIEILVEDPANIYLPRKFRLSLPRSSKPEEADSPDSLFNPVEISLYPSSNAPLRPNWSTIRASVMEISQNGEKKALSGSLLRVIRTSDDHVLASGYSDERGETLIIIPGVPITQFAEGSEDTDGPSEETDPEGDPAPEVENPEPPLVTELPVKLETSYNPKTLWPVNPDELEKNHPSATFPNPVALKLRMGRMEKENIELKLDP